MTTEDIEEENMNTPGLITATEIVNVLVGEGHDREDVLAVIDSLIEAGHYPYGDDDERRGADDPEQRHFDEADLATLRAQLLAR